MKHQNKLIFTFFVVCLTLFFSGCEKDLYPEIRPDNSSKSISFEQFKQETGLKDFQTSININSNISDRNADGSYELNDFIVDTDLIKRVAINEKVTYTFRIEPKIITSENFFNLIVFNKNGVWENSIIELKPTPENLHQLKNGLSNKFAGSISLVYQPNIGNIINTENPCQEVIYLDMHCTMEGECREGFCDGCLTHCITVTQYNFCTDSPSNGGALTGFVSPIPVTGGPNGTGNTLPSYTDPSGYFFDPNLPPIGEAFTRNKRASEFWNSLTNGVDGQKAWASSNADNYNELIEYLLDNFDFETVAFAKEVINRMINNPGIFTSVKPFLIEDKI